MSPGHRHHHHNSGRPIRTALRARLPAGEWTVLAFCGDEGHFFCQLDGHFRGVWNQQKLEYSISITCRG